MMERAELERLRGAVDRLVEQQGAHLIDFVVRGDRGRRVLEVFVDSESGVSLDLCSAISRALLQAIDAENLVDGGYRLEVSSPGLSRPLQYPWQYRKHIGRQLEVRWRRGAEAQTATGELVAADDEAITVRMGKSADGTRILFVDLVQATVKAPW